MSFGSKVGSFQLRILEILKEKPLHGYGIMSEVEARTGHRPTTAALYPALQKLENYGLIESETKPGLKRDRKEYSLTPAGREELSNAFGLMVQFCISGIQDDFAAAQKELYGTLKVRDGATILYPSINYESIRDLAQAFKGKGKVVALVPSRASKDTIEKAVRRDRLPNVHTVKEGELESLPLDDASVDVAIYPFALCRCSPWAASPDSTVAVKEAVRALKPGGRLVVIDLEKIDHAMLRILSKNMELCGFERQEVVGVFESSGLENVVATDKKGILVVEGSKSLS